MIVHSTEPLNAEPALDRLRESFVTAQADFYVRCHGEIPRLDAARHRLRVDGLVAAPLDLSLADLRARFAARSITAVVQCAGNRRGDLRLVRPVSGDPWAPGAIGNAVWTGVALADVLREAGVPREAGAQTGPALHAAFQSADLCRLGERQVRYGASIPLAKAMSPEVLLAWAMNGEDLAPEHGFPLRVVVPGFAGVRSPKWLQRITVQDAPSASPFQAEDYKLFPPDVRPQTADPARGITIDDMPINAAICDPAPDARLRAGPVTVRGYAIATVRPVARVDVSADDGRTWRQATLDAGAVGQWSWVFWQATLDAPPGECVLAVRAWDSAGQTQPARGEEVWNCKGYLNTAWHRVAVRVD